MKGFRVGSVIEGCGFFWIVIFVLFIFVFSGGIWELGGSRIGSEVVLGGGEWGLF